MSNPKETNVDVAVTAPLTSAEASPSTSAEVIHNVRPALTDHDNILHASNHADSTAPEGGYGWVVIFACASISFWIVGTVYSWGVMRTYISKLLLLVWH